MNNIQYSPAESLCSNKPINENGCGATPKGEINCSQPTLVAGMCGTAAVASTATPLELHVCMGLNACKGHDFTGANTCAGTGMCATAAKHTCHTLNNCKGQGGCGLYGSAEEQMFPGQNECAWQGSCAVPIQAERYSTLGENKGKSVWLLARKLFEQRMEKANRTYGVVPNYQFRCGPPQAWLVTLFNGSYDSCGNSGNKVCSFGYNESQTNGQDLCQGKSIAGSFPNEAIK